MERMFGRPLSKTAKRLGVQQAQIHVLDDTDESVIYQVQKVEGCTYDQAKLLIRVRNHIELCNFHKNYSNQ